MICKICGSEFNIENFDMCPYCLTPVEKNNVEFVIYEINEVEEYNNAIEQTEKVESHFESDFNTIDEYVVTEEDLIEESEIDETEVVLIDEIGLSVRAVNAFRRAGIYTLNELIEFLATNSVSDLKNVGEKTVRETEELMEKIRVGEIGFNSIMFDNNIQNATNGHLFKNISIDVDYLSVDALVDLGLPNKAVSKLRLGGIRCCGEMRSLSKNDLLVIVGRRYMDMLPDVAKVLEKDIISLLNDVLDNTRNSREYEIYLRRAQGETLQEIASNLRQEDGVITRERVRQIEKAYLRTIQPFVRELFYILKGGNKYLLVQDLLDIYDDDEYDQVLLYACKSFENFEYLDFADLFVEKEEEYSVEQKLLTFISEIIGDGIDLDEIREDIEVVLVENKFDYINLDIIKNLLAKNNYRTYGNFVVKGRANYAILCMYVVRKFFPDGIKLSQSDSEQSEDLIKLREIIDEKYQGLVVPASDRALSSTLVRSGLVLRGRGQYISQEYINIDESLLSEIKSYIDEKETNRVFYNEVFAHFEGALNVLCGVDNYNYLHGILALRYPEAYEYGRDYLLKNGIDDSQAESIADRIYDFICKKGRPISKTELYQEFRGFSNVMLIMPFTNDNRLMQWEYNFFACSGIQSIDPDDIVDLRTFITELFEKNKGYASDGLLLEKVSEKRPDFIKKNRIQTEMNLHYIVANVFAEEMDFRRPHICEKGKIDLSSTKSVVLYLLDNPDFFSFEQYNEIVEHMKWSKVTASAVLSDIEDDYVRLSIDKYCKKSALHVPQDVKVCIRSIIDQNMEDGIMPLLNFEMDEFTEWEYSWNEFLFETVIKECFSDIEVIHPIMKDRRYQRGIAVNKSTGLASYSQIVAKKMLSTGCDCMTENQLLSFLVVHNLAKKAIPNELTNSEHIKKEGDYYKVVLEV